MIDFAKQHLIDQTVSKSCRKRLINAAKSILYWAGKTRFSAKLTGPSRINYLKSIFPRAKFMHMIRDG